MSVLEILFFNLTTMNKRMVSRDTEISEAESYALF